MRWRPLRSRAVEGGGRTRPPCRSYAALAFLLRRFAAFLARAGRPEPTWYTVPRFWPLFLSEPAARRAIAAFLAVFRSTPVASAMAPMPWLSLAWTCATILADASSRLTLLRPEPFGRPGPRTTRPGRLLRAGPASPVVRIPWRASSVDLRTSLSSSVTNSEMRFLIWDSMTLGMGNLDGEGAAG